MLNGRLSRFISDFEQFRWVDGARLEAGRLSEARIFGRRAVAALLCHDWMPDVHQRPSVIRAITQSAFLCAVNDLDIDAVKTIAAHMAAQLQEL